MDKVTQGMYLSGCWRFLNVNATHAKVLFTVFFIYFIIIDALKDTRKIKI